MLNQNVAGYFHPAGRIFIILSACATIILSLLSVQLFWFGAVVTAWCAYFFRDPERVTPQRAGLIVSPADGKVVAVRQVEPEADLGLGEEERTRISIFLNIFDVHVNRIPSDGAVKSCRYRKGAFVNASLDKASRDNERMAIAMELAGEHPYAGKTMGFVQIAGLIARRIECSVHEGDTVKSGQRYGIIRFGSRVDIYLPVGLAPLVSSGQYMIGGETVLADCASTEPTRRGEPRE